MYGLAVRLAALFGDFRPEQRDVSAARGKQKRKPHARPSPGYLPDVEAPRTPRIERVETPRTVHMSNMRSRKDWEPGVRGAARVGVSDLTRSRFGDAMAILAGGSV